MATIVFIMLPESGHINGTFKLCKQLTEKGHEVVHLNIPDMEEKVTKQGIDFFSFGEEHLPKGFLEQMEEKISEENTFGQLKILRDYIKRARALFEDLYQYEFDSILAEIDPDLFIVDVLLPFAGIFASSTDVPVLSLSVTLPVEFNWNLPPLGSYCVPASDWKGKLTVAWKWGLRSVEALFWQLAGSLVGFNLWWEVRNQAKLWGFPREKIDYIASFQPYVKLDELVLAPAEFDFPAAQREDRHYIGPLVDLEREEPDFDWKKIDNSRPLIYCSFGTQAFRVNKTHSLMQKIIDVVKAHKEWQLVLTTGNQFSLDSFTNVTKDIHILSYAPQAALLDKADLFISHGGLNSVKESIMSQVPLLVIPLTRDQPGNASRVEYHDLGFTCLPSQAKKNSLKSMISTLLTDEEIKANVEQMADVFHQYQVEQRGIKVIEEYLTKENSRRKFN